MKLWAIVGGKSVEQIYEHKLWTKILDTSFGQKFWTNVINSCEQMLWAQNWSKVWDSFAQKLLAKDVNKSCEYKLLTKEQKIWTKCKQKLALNNSCEQ